MLYRIRYSLKYMLVALMAILIFFSAGIPAHADSPEKDKEILAAQKLIMRGTDDFSLHIKNYSDIPAPSDITSMSCKNGKARVLPESKESRGDYLNGVLVKHLDVHIEPSEDGYTATYHAECTLTPEERVKVIEDIVPDLASQVKGDTEKEKALSAAKVVTKHLSYKTTGNIERMSFAKAISENEGTCRHYSVLYYLVLKELGIDCRTITGYPSKESVGEKGERHEWNIVKIDNEWYYSDVTSSDRLLGCRFLLKPADNPKFKDRIPDEEYLWLTNQVKTNRN